MSKGHLRPKSMSDHDDNIGLLLTSKDGIHRHFHDDPPHSGRIFSANGVGMSAEKRVNPLGFWIPFSRLPNLLLQEPLKDNDLQQIAQKQYEAKRCTNLYNDFRF